MLLSKAEVNGEEFEKREIYVVCSNSMKPWTDFVNLGWTNQPESAKDANHYCGWHDVNQLISVVNHSPAPNEVTARALKLLKEEGFEKTFFNRINNIWLSFRRVVFVSKKRRFVKVLYNSKTLKFCPENERAVGCFEKRIWPPPLINCQIESRPLFSNVLFKFRRL